MNNKLYDVVVARKGQAISYLEKGLLKEEADRVYSSWLEVFNPEVYFDPVPQIKVVPHVSSFKEE